MPVLALFACRSPAQVQPQTRSPEPARAHVQPATIAPTAFEAVSTTRLCATAGRLQTIGPREFHVDTGGMRAVVREPSSASAELAFTYRGPSKELEPLADGEVRRQIGLKLRAKDTCNVVYVMWHVEPTPGVFVSVKHNPGKATHAECGANGYINVRNGMSSRPPEIRVGERHTLRASIDGEELRVLADGALVWKGDLPAETSTFEGPAGVRVDNAAFDFELRLPFGHTPSECAAP